MVDAKQLKNDYNLGRLDGLVSSPNRCSKVRVADSKKIAAILLETNIIELQRHLLTITVQNQVSAHSFTHKITLFAHIAVVGYAVRVFRQPNTLRACGMQLKLII